MHINLNDKVAIVTGSAHRVGRAIAIELARQGVHIMVHYHQSEPSQVRDTIHEIKSHGVDAFEVQADIALPEGVDTVFEAIRENFGRIDILVNSSSVFQKRAFMDVTVDDWNLTFNVNVRAPFLMTQAAAKMMADNAIPGGSIVNICDKGVDRPWIAYPHHGVSKAALWALTEVSAVSLGPTIRVNAVVPGPVLKPAGSNMSDADWAKLGENNPLKMTGEAGDVARAVAYLCSESFLTGTLIHVNAGEHLT